VVDDYADETPRERMLRQKKERQDAEEKMRIAELAEARRQNHEEKKRIAALRSPGAAGGGIGGSPQAQADGSGGREAAIAAATEKEALWRAKQQQALDAVGGQDKLPQISPVRTGGGGGGGGLTPDQFEVQESGGGCGYGVQQLPPAVEPSHAAGGERRQDYAEPEPYGDDYGGGAEAEGDGEYTAESFDDYDTIVAGEVVEEEVLVRRAAPRRAAPRRAAPRHRRERHCCAGVGVTLMSVLLEHCYVVHRRNVKASSTRCVI
jgi:hypothetical protein